MTFQYLGRAAQFVEKGLFSGLLRGDADDGTHRVAGPRSQMRARRNLYGSGRPQRRRSIVTVMSTSAGVQESSATCDDEIAM
jgi:hypothetical protein